MMTKNKLNWIVGYTSSPDAYPEEMFPAQVPGAVQLDYAKAKNWPPFYEGTNYKDYGWMEDVYWLYTAPLEFTLSENQLATLSFSGIDYQYQISINDEILAESEGMFSSVTCDVTRFSGTASTLKVLISPAPKAGRSGDRNEVRKSCKSAAGYGWDWHPRLISLGLWDEVSLIIQDKPAITNVAVSYQLNDTFERCDLTVFARFSDLPADNAKIRLSLSALFADEAATKQSVPNSNTIVAEKLYPLTSCQDNFSLTVSKPRLWNPSGYGKQPLYLLSLSTLDEQGNAIDEYQRKIGFRRARLVMNEGSWELPDQFPKSRSDAPATFEINGQRIFAKGSNWINARIFPGEMTEEHYDRLLTLVKDANMNILRIWGGGFINKESFYDLCDEKGIMIWQEFPLACNEYPDDEDYLAVLEKEATAIVKRLRTHPCLVLWCGGNELFNGWSKMTDQHHALRLLDSICYREDRHTPFIMTSPLNGMAHGHYLNYDEETGQEFISLLVRAHNTAYTEFGCPGGTSPDLIRTFMSEEDFNDLQPDNEVWIAHHGFYAWRQGCWTRIPEAEYYFGGYTDTEDLFRKTQFLQSMCYRSCFEEMRKQWPYCSMALNWCFNEPWPTVGHNCLISYPDYVRPSYYAVQQALRPSLASLRIDRHLWWSSELFQAEIWILNDSLTMLDAGGVTAHYSFGEEAETEWGTLRYQALAPQTNLQCGMLQFKIPENFSGEFRIRLEVSNHPEMNSEYTYLCRRKLKLSTEGMLNV